MTLTQTKETISSWIRSCTSQDQLTLCVEIIKEFVEKRFQGSQLDVEDLMGVVRETELIIVADNSNSNDRPLRRTLLQNNHIEQNKTQK